MTIDHKKAYLTFVLTLSTLITFLLASATYYINFWPTDSFYFYLPTAANLFALPSLSDMHNLPAIDSLGRLAMRGKETLILGIAVFQKILNDDRSLYPNILLLICSLQISGMLVYLIIKKIFNQHIGLAAYLLFVTCFWPYLYVLQGAHQPLVLMFFLLTVFFILHINFRQSFALYAGISIGFMIFASPTALIYTPYFLLFFIFPNFQLSKLSFSKKTACHASLFIAGCAAIILLFTMPDPITNLHKFLKFVAHSQHSNHFDYYHSYLAKYFPPPYSFGLPKPISFRGAGWSWIIKYFLLIMPVMFTVYLLSTAYLLKIAKNQYSIIFAILICLSTPLVVEMAQVSQFGRNYFSWMIGMIFIISCALYHLKNEEFFKKYKKQFITIFAALLITHAVFNFNIFLTDVFPSRMGTAQAHQWLKKNNVKKIYVYQYHLNNKYTAAVLNNPKSTHRILFKSMDAIHNAQDGYMLIPPITGKNIWNDCAADDFMKDPQLTKLYNAGTLSQSIAASFPTLASSKIWVQEEEVCTFRDLILNQITDQDRKKGHLLILDINKLKNTLINQ